MKLSLKIAIRYLFGRRSTNAINVITSISVIGIGVGTAAIILVLSVFNGFEKLITGFLNDFNPDIKVVPVEGKFFEVSDSTLQSLLTIEDVRAISRTIEENALFEYKGTQEVGLVKGVDTLYNMVTSIEKRLRRGKFKLRDGVIHHGVMGVGMYSKLSVNLGDLLTPVKVYMPRRKNKGPLSKDFKTMLLYPAGTFSVQSEDDYKTIISNYDFVNKLLDFKRQNSALEIDIQESSDETEIIAQLQTILGDGFEIKNRYKQDEAFLKIMNIEKWVSYLILSLVLLLVFFNLVGALWMIVLDKKRDISILKAVGYTRPGIRNIFLCEGFLISSFGLFLGVFLAGFFYFLQKQYGIIPIPEGFIVDAYPIDMKTTDLLIVATTVLVIGFIGSLLPAYRASRMEQAIRN